MRSALTAMLNIFFVLFCFAPSAFAQSTTTLENVRSWLKNSWDNLAEASVDTLKTNQSSDYAIRCEQYNFDLFFMLFSEDRYFQESATMFPLKVTSVSPEDSPTREDLDKSEDSIINQRFLAKKKDGTGVNIFPNRQQRALDNLTCSIESDSPRYGMNSVVLRREGTGIHYKFIFTWNGCWFLSEVVDSSI